MSVLGLLASGYFMIFFGFGGFSGAGMHIHIMHLTGLLMVALFVYLFHLPWLAYKRLIDEEDYAGAAGRLNLIRKIVGANLALGSTDGGDRGEWALLGLTDKRRASETGRTLFVFPPGKKR